MESKLRSKPKPKILEAVADYDGDSFMSTDESYIDDDENDPDWRKTPLYNRIQKLEARNYYFIVLTYYFIFINHIKLVYKIFICNLKIIILR